MRSVGGAGVKLELSATAARNCDVFVMPLQKSKFQLSLD